MINDFEASLRELEPEQAANIKALIAKFMALNCISTYTKLEIGPIVTTYYFKPLPTTPLNKILARTEDIALAVGAESILITRVRDEISIAIPNRNRTIISFDKCLYSMVAPSNNEDSLQQLPILMGQDTKGCNFSIDLVRQPHLLIAGSTGSGKSVFLSQLITSLAVAKSPAELRLHLVDTKRLDLTLFEKLPHASYIITNVSDLRKRLEDLLQEVRDRTEMMEGTCRNIAEWNLTHVKKLNYQVLIIDELADVIAQDKAEAKNEDKDTRETRISALLSQLAQISRAAGIHIIAATQRPSVQIINGDIKANFPARVCFKLPSQFDSRVVLDEGGAENLLGRGDYLYKTAEDSTLRRAHSAFVQIKDIQNIIAQHDFIRQSLGRS